MEPPLEARRRARAVVTAHLWRDTTLLDGLGPDPDPAATTAALGRMCATLVRILCAHNGLDPVDWWARLMRRVVTREDDP